MRICGICDEELKNDDKIVACNKCNGLYHLECFEDLGGCANPYCENYVSPSLSLAQLSKSSDTDEDIDKIKEYYTENDYDNDFSNTEIENEDDYEISDANTDENENKGTFADTSPKKSVLRSIIEWLIFIGLIALAFFLLLELLKL